MKQKPKYVKGKFRNTVLDAATQKLYVRKAVTVEGVQRQVWRLCEPQTAARVREILQDIDLEFQAEKTLLGYTKKDAELARLFLQVQENQISFLQFKYLVSIKK
jgi:hypothetical protein